MHNAPQDRPAGDEFEQWELDLIERQVAGFFATHRPAHDLEFDDLFQECILHWWSQRDLYDERRGASRQTFLRRVVRRKLQDLARRWAAQKRVSGQRTLSLDAPPSHRHPHGAAIGDMLPDHRDVSADVSVAVHLNRLTAKLSDRQRRIIEGVRAGMTKTALSERLEISRDTLHEELRRIQQVFRDGGLASHLE